MGEKCEWGAAPGITPKLEWGAGGGPPVTATSTTGRWS